MNAWKVSRMGDAAIVFEFDKRIDLKTNAYVLSVAKSLRRVNCAGVRDVIESYCAVTVEYDPLGTDVCVLIRDLEEAAKQASVSVLDGSTLTVPVCYGGDFGPDLSIVAECTGLREDEVIAIHGSKSYRVFMLGFLPGFAYLGPLDEQLVVPRRKIPRLRVPACSVAVAGHQTGVYPLQSPGGWQLIGKTPTCFFEPDKPKPFLLSPGDNVRFEAVSRADFYSLSRETKP
jgi:inhibitor of KinA